MSRIGNAPIQPSVDGVDVTVTGSSVTVNVKGPNGELSQKLTGGITAAVEDGEAARVDRPSDDEPRSKSLHGLYRSLLFRAWSRA